MNLDDIADPSHAIMPGDHMMFVAKMLYALPDELLLNLMRLCLGIMTDRVLGGIRNADDDQQIARTARDVCRALERSAQV